MQLIACLSKRWGIHIFYKPRFEPTLDQKLQLLAFKNHGGFVLKIPQIYFFAGRLQPKQALNQTKIVSGALSILNHGFKTNFYFQNLLNKKYFNKFFNLIHNYS